MRSAAEENGISETEDIQYADNNQRTGERNYTFYSDDDGSAGGCAASGESGAVGKPDGGGSDDDFHTIDSDEDLPF